MHSKGGKCIALNDPDSKPLNIARESPTKEKKSKPQTSSSPAHQGIAAQWEKWGNQ